MPFGRCCLLLVLLLAACSKTTSTLPDAGTDAGQATDAGTAPLCKLEFKHTQGLPCNRDADCTTDHCYFPVDTSTNTAVAGYCTTICDIDSNTDTCPTNYACVPDAVGSGGECAPYMDTSPNDHSLPLGSPCERDGDCVTSKCGGIDNQDGTLATFCTKDCTAAASCGDCESCAAAFDGSGSQCQPAGSAPIGARCQDRQDCASFDCLGFCTQQCGGTQGIDCPSGSVCTPVMLQGRALSVCVDPGQKGKSPAGQPCTFNFECQDGTTCQDQVCAAQKPLGNACQSDNDCGPGLNCHALAPDITLCTTDCGGGCTSDSSCVAVDMDTSLKLYNQVSGQPLVSNDDIDPDANIKWSAITNYQAAAGTYWLEAKGYGLYAGAYQLELLTGSDTPATVMEITGAHSTPGTAQTIAALPTVVAASISRPKEYDYYTFTLAAPATITLRTQRGPASQCFPNSMLQQKAIGDQCTADFVCQGKLCEGTLLTCGQSCMQDTDCGSDNKCMDFDSYHSCITAAQYQHLMAGADCHYSWECYGSKGYCAHLHGANFCSQTCSGPMDPCEIVSPGQMSHNECAPFTTTHDGMMQTDFVCVPKGAMQGAASTPCEIDTDCQTGLSCQSGQCG